MTDIEGSCALWEADEALAASLIRRHDHLIRRSVDAAQGYIFSVGGDSFAIAFSQPARAAGAALRIREEIRALPHRLSVRQAIHTGTAHERDGGYYGPSLNRCARMLSCISGGMVVVSEATRALLSEEDAGFHLASLRRESLRGLSRPEHLSLLIDH